MESHGVFLSQVRVNVYYENSTRPGLPQAYLRSVHVSVLCLQWFRAHLTNSNKTLLVWLLETIVHFSGFVLA